MQKKIEVLEKEVCKFYTNIAKFDLKKEQKNETLLKQGQKMKLYCIFGKIKLSFKNSHFFFIILIACRCGSCLY